MIPSSWFLASILELLLSAARLVSLVNRWHVDSFIALMSAPSSPAAAAASAAAAATLASATAAGSAGSAGAGAPSVTRALASTVTTPSGSSLGLGLGGSSAGSTAAGAGAAGKGASTTSPDRKSVSPKLGSRGDSKSLSAKLAAQRADDSFFVYINDPMLLVSGAPLCLLPCLSDF